ncbi:hypothetical protein, unlikely [Trypanosoma brucei gambiense DAL972]|uniref:Uncharacterized protein n=1 Tax=Trypanosoma brucei gambiense (strain MHOM/CI/86/DAL972) TaxID=679716 RepID=D0A4A1_TRYB9|nr:hypothetical protein, unlikely [Trypanosoma brucei gambiense DAL972]CBH16095.1 hypothetical protein, unlikely [Trypanosoma brucei gambiense DAL972]|eukprot:XP_011778359.1 hypothetical protein, unlikely [Trypanosoma brucei gambiense DAL972]
MDRKKIRDTRINTVVASTCAKPVVHQGGSTAQHCRPKLRKSEVQREVNTSTVTWNACEESGMRRSEPRTIDTPSHSPPTHGEGTVQKKRWGKAAPPAMPPEVE